MRRLAARLFPCCVTRMVDLRIVRKMVAHTTYVVESSVIEEKTRGKQYVVRSEIHDAGDAKQTILAFMHATCVNVAADEQELLARYPEEAS